MAACPLEGLVGDHDTDGNRLKRRSLTELCE